MLPAPTATNAVRRGRPPVLHAPRSAARWPVLAGLVLLGLSGGAVARPFSEPDDRNLDRHGHYRSRDGSDVHRPARSLDGRKPAGATAKCRDGTWSFSHTHRGTCSRHGGVAHWEG